jgi:haloalkane dehalogenase
MIMRRQMLTGLAGAVALGAAGGHATATPTESPTEAGDAAAAAAYRTARRFVATRFGRIAYVERGAGDAALFLHGFPLNSFQWRGALDRLSPIRRCVAPDFLGLGHSEVAAGQSVAPSAQADMLAALLDALSIHAVDLVANDSGGAVAQIFVTRYPGRVRTLLLTNCDVEDDSPPPALLPVIDLARAGTYPDQWLVPWLTDKAQARSAEGFGGMCFSRPGQPTDTALDEYLGPLVSSPQRKALTNAYTLGLTPNPLAGIEAKLKACQVPARIVWGMRDPIFSQKSPDYLDRTLPGSRGVRRIAEAKLFFPEEYPDLMAEEARRLWRLS